MNRSHMTGDHHGRTAGRPTLLARAMDEILGTHSQQLIRGPSMRTWPRRDHPADQSRLSHRNIGSKARDTARDQQRPRKYSALAANQPAM
jgi:hypothetical protein